MPGPIFIAECPVHGLHGQRATCYICGTTCEQVPVVRANERTFTTTELMDDAFIRRVFFPFGPSVDEETMQTARQNMSRALHERTEDLDIPVTAESLAVDDVTAPHGLQERDQFADALTSAVNYHSKDNGSNTPDYILSGFLQACLEAFDAGVNARSAWYGHFDSPGQGPGPRGAERKIAHVDELPGLPEVDPDVIEGRVPPDRQRISWEQLDLTEQEYLIGVNLHLIIQSGGPADPARYSRRPVTSHARRAFEEAVKRGYVTPEGKVTVEGHKRAMRGSD